VPRPVPCLSTTAPPPLPPRPQLARRQVFRSRLNTGAAQTLHRPAQPPPNLRCPKIRTGRGQNKGSRKNPLHTPHRPRNAQNRRKTPFLAILASKAAFALLRNRPRGTLRGRSPMRAFHGAASHNRPIMRRGPPLPPPLDITALCQPPAGTRRQRSAAGRPGPRCRAPSRPSHSGRHLARTAGTKAGRTIRRAG